MLKQNNKQAIRILRLIAFFLILFIKTITAQEKELNLYEASNCLPHIHGKSENADYLYVTAGDRLYCIGKQAGSFPKIGFHVPGQMGGIWQQPIKLMDGFSLHINNPQTGERYQNICDEFISYSFVTKFQYHIQNQKIQVIQTQFVPDNLPVLVVEYIIRNNSDQNRNIELELDANINLMPVWLGEKSGMIDQKDTLFGFDEKNSIMYFCDKGNNWFTGIGFENKKTKLKKIKETTYKDNGITGVITLQCQIPSGKSERFRFYISGSLNNTQEIADNITTARSQLPNLFREKQNRFDTIEKTAEISVPDKLLQDAYKWGKYSTDWLIRNVPGLGKGMSAGFPDYPWFFSNDQASTFMALTGTRQPELFYNSFQMLKQISDSVNHNCGRIIHEVSSNGVVYDKGRMEESQLHIIAAWQIFNWTGNFEFLKENYAFAKRTWRWLQEHDANHNGYLEGFGGVEIEGLNDEMLDVQVNTFRFLEILSKMALLFNDKADAAVYAQKARILEKKINKDWWVNSESRYADFITTKDKALKIIDGALLKRVQKGRNDWAEKKLSNLKEQVINNTYPYKGYVVYYNPSGLQPMNEGMTDTLRTKQMLENARFFTNKFGMYITGIERPDDVTMDEKKFQKDSIFTYSRAVMPAATSGLAQAAVKFGMPDTALMYMHKTLNSFSFATPGTTYEVSPDYGMFVQAWNVSGINIPLIQYFFGVQPEAYKKEITINIQMPTDWNYATLNNLIVGNTKISVQYTKAGNKIACTISSTKPGWKIIFKLCKKASNVVVNKSHITSGKQQLELTGSKNTVQYTINL